MSLSDPTDPDYLNDRVFQGFWRRYERAGSSDLLLTLSIYKGLIVLAILLLTVEYGGSRAWVILRFIISKLVWKPVSLADQPEDQVREQVPDRLLKISRGRAVMNTFALVETAVQWLLRFKCSHGSRPAREHTDPDELYDPGQSAWYGVGALANIIAFVFLGIGLPLLLTEGTINPPVVKSRPMPECQSYNPGLSKVASFVQYSAVLKSIDSIAQLCQGSPRERCYEGYGLVSPRIEKRRLDGCPFPGPVCDNSTKALEITHFNLSAYELGSNSPSSVSLSHRTTCAPVDIDKFTLLLRKSNRGIITARATDNLTLADNFFFLLHTPNGPNGYSKNWSGHDAARANVQSSIQILPSYRGTILDDPKWESWEAVHQHIRRDDGHSFLIVNIAGRVTYGRPLNDPFFPAHAIAEESRYLSNRTEWWPDREATAMACVDQYEFCIPGSEGTALCSGWSNGDYVVGMIVALFWIQRGHQIPIDFDSDESSRRLKSILRSPEGRAAVMDGITHLPAAINAMSLHQSMTLRNMMMPKSVQLRDQESALRLWYTDEQWTLEVETWFTKATLDALFRIKGGAKFAFSHRIPATIVTEIGPHIQKEWSTCGRVLFRNPGYTNINVAGFCSILVAIFFITIISYDIARIYDNTTSILSTFRDLKGSYPNFKRNPQSFGVMTKLHRRLSLFKLWNLDPSSWAPMVLSQLNSRPRPPGNRSSNGSNGGVPGAHGVRTEDDGDVEQGRENIHMDDIDVAQLRRGEEIDNAVGSR
jgi:hypothetical protein